MKQIGAALIALTVVACAPRAPQQQQPQALQVEDDQFSPRATFVGLEQADASTPQTVKEWFIRSFVDKRSGEVDHQLYVHVSYVGDRRRYEIATDDHATSLPFVRIERDRGACKYGSCDYDEDFGLGLRDATLRERAGAGFQVKVVAHSSDSIILTIAPGQILPQLAAVDAYRRAHALIGAREPASPTLPADKPGRVGVNITPMPPSLALSLKLAPGVGVLVLGIVPGSAADKAGVKAGDVILELDGKPSNAPQDFLAQVQVIPVGTATRLVLWRGNARIEAMVKL